MSDALTKLLLLLIVLMELPSAYGTGRTRQSSCVSARMIRLARGRRAAVGAPAFGPRHLCSSAATAAYTYMHMRDGGPPSASPTPKVIAMACRHGGMPQNSLHQRFPNTCGGVNMSIHMSLHMRFHMPVHMSTHMSTHMSIHMCTSDAPGRGHHARS